MTIIERIVANCRYRIWDDNLTFPISHTIPEGRRADRSHGIGRAVMCHGGWYIHIAVIAAVVSVPIGHTHGRAARDRVIDAVNHKLVDFLDVGELRPGCCALVTAL